MTSDRLDWDKLRVFRVVAELSSMSAAATQLSESAPTIARKIAELEDNLGTKLLSRSTRGVELTDAGRKVLRHAHAMAEAADALHQEASSQTESVEGVITLVTGDGVGPYWIAPRLVQFQDRNPRAQIRLIVQEDPADVTSGEADVAIHFTEPKRQDVIAHRLGVQHYVGFASPAYLREHPAPESLFEYHKHRCLLHRSYVNQVERWAPKVPELRKMIDFAFVSNSGTALVQACAAGNGIALLPSFMAELDSRIEPLALPEIAPIQFWVVYTERFRRLPRGGLFIDWLRRLFEQDDAIWFREEFVHPRDRFANVHRLSATPRREP